MKFSWESLPKPCTVLAPMEGVTDTVFRQMVSSVHKPDVLYTEFVSVEGMNSPGRQSIFSKLQFVPSERPIIAQLWGVTPDYFFRSAQYIRDMGFDGVDINMGCPDKNVIKMGAGAALIENPLLAKKIIQSVKKGVQTGATSIPVSVKTRIGLATKKTEEWIRFLLSNDVQAITVHGLTAKEQYRKPADWEEIRKAVVVRNTYRPKTRVIGNGNVTSYQETLERSAQYGVDGVMIGRGIFQAINCFDPHGKTLSQQQLFEYFQKHLDLFEATYPNGSRQFATIKKFFRCYIRNQEGASARREQFMAIQTPDEARTLIAHGTSREG